MVIGNLYIPNCSHEHPVLVCGADLDFAGCMDCQADQEVEDLGQVELGQFLFYSKMTKSQYDKREKICI